LADPKPLALAQRLYDGGQADVAIVCRARGISRAALYRYVTPPSADDRARAKA
jgi:hypothetical protein